jgi:hypothetical protein
MALSFLLLLAAAFITSSTYLLIQRGRRNIIIERLYIARRRVSGARTPPRSLSPGKKTVSSTEPNYADTFPPSRRFILAEIDIASKPSVEGEEPEELDGAWRAHLVPMNLSYMDADESCYLPCGFSVKEIKALGDFPDYATLSGVPLPNPYLEFDIKKALPRPYRPFRWAYHQTMCKLNQRTMRIVADNE